jgi:F0F1-type ATP synthase alpha subunit
VVLFAIQKGFADAIPVKEVPQFLAEALDCLRSHNAAVLTDIASSKQLTAKAEKGIIDALSTLLKLRQSSGSSSSSSGTAAA